MAGAGYPETVQELSDRSPEGPLQPAWLRPELPEPWGPHEPPKEADPAHRQHQLCAEALLSAQAPRSVSPTRGRLHPLTMLRDPEKPKDAGRFEASGPSPTNSRCFSLNFVTCLSLVQILFLGCQHFL